MKDYKENLETAKREMLKDATAILLGQKISDKWRGAGEIVEVKSIQPDLCDFDVVCRLECEKETFNSCLYTSTLHGTITFEDENVRAQFLDFCLNAVETHNILRKAAKEKQEAELKAAEEKKLQQKIQEKIDKQLKSAEEMSVKKFVPSKGFYYELGYIAKHAKKITADMPDYLEHWFIKQFGMVEHRAVNQSHKTPSGIPPQFALSLKVDLDSNDNMPSSLGQYLGKVNKEIKPISNTYYVFKLVADYGFEFGKIQNVDNIKKNIPQDKIAEFEEGYSL